MFLQKRYFLKFRKVQGKAAVSESLQVRLQTSSKLQLYKKSDSSTGFST